MATEVWANQILLNNRSKLTGCKYKTKALKQALPALDGYQVYQGMPHREHNPDDLIGIIVRPRLLPGRKGPGHLDLVCDVELRHGITAASLNGMKLSPVLNCAVQSDNVVIKFNHVVAIGLVPEDEDDEIRELRRAYFKGEIP